MSKLKTILYRLVVSSVIALVAVIAAFYKALIVTSSLTINELLMMHFVSWVIATILVFTVLDRSLRR